MQLIFTILGGNILQYTCLIFDIPNFAPEEIHEFFSAMEPNNVYLSKFFFSRGGDFCPDLYGSMIFVGKYRLCSRHSVTIVLPLKFPNFGLLL